MALYLNGKKQDAHKRQQNDKLPGTAHPPCVPMSGDVVYLNGKVGKVNRDTMIVYFTDESTTPCVLGVRFLVC